MNKCKNYEEIQVRNLRQELWADGCDLAFQPQFGEEDDCAQLVWERDGSNRREVIFQ
jgi:hypothetical protein